MVVIPSLRVCFSFINVPLYGYVFQSSTHTSGRRYVKSSPRENYPNTFCAPLLSWLKLLPTTVFCRGKTSLAPFLFLLCKTPNPTHKPQTFPVIYFYDGFCHTYDIAGTPDYTADENRTLRLLFLLQSFQKHV